MISPFSALITQRRFAHRTMRHCIAGGLLLVLCMLIGCKPPTAPPQSTATRRAASDSTQEPATRMPAESTSAHVPAASIPEHAPDNEVAITPADGEDGNQDPPTNPNPEAASDGEDSSDVDETIVASAVADTEPATQGDPASDPAAVEAPAPPENPPERIILLTSQGPLIFDLTIWIDDLPYRQFMEQTIDEVLQLADEDESGRVTWDELTQSRHFVYGQFGNPMINTQRQRQDIVRAYDINQNQRVDRNEVPGFLVQNAGSSRIFRLETMDVNEEAVSEVFQWLDVDQDRRLSAAELSAATVRLRYLDSNDDDTLLPDELLTSTSGDMPTANRPSRYVQPAAVLLGDYTDWPALLFLLEERYGFGNPLVPSDFDLLGGPLRDLDSDQDDQIDVEEIKRIAEIPPHFAVTYGFGVNPDRTHQGIVLDEVREALKSIVRHSTVRGITNLNLDHIEVTLSSSDRGSSPLDALNAVWQQVDGDKNDYLDETEFQQATQLFGNVPLAGIDENQDDRVFRDEAAAFLRRRDSALQGRLQATAGVQADSLLSYLDQDDDQRLTARELRSLAECLAELDSNQDGVVSLSEIPRAMTIRVVRGIATPQNVPQPAQPAVEQPEAADVPNWFVNMDANRDGELSAKEFLGTDEQFRQLDQNDDGFVEASEIRKDGS